MSALTSRATAPLRLTVLVLVAGSVDPAISALPVLFS
jgi:hypothetical protein